jgi:putative restriction endonuclease
VLQHYIYLFQHLNRGNGVKGLAPHKPQLLLAIIQLLEKGWICENRICINAELVAEFVDLSAILRTELSAQKFALPFYHLKNDGFWNLRTHLGMEIALTTSNSVRSFAQLKAVVDYGYFADPLWELLSHSSSRGMLKAAIMEAYFPNQHELKAPNDVGLFDFAIGEILNHPIITYHPTNEKGNELEQFVRGSLFRREVTRVYNHTCCISGMRLITTRSAQMIDACHIVPFADTRNNSINNGISLCPNLHRAFDRFLVSIDNDYRVHVAKDILEDGGYGLAQFSGKMIQLPNEEQYWPALVHLQWHWDKFTTN